MTTLTILEFNQTFGAVAEQSDIGKYFTTNGTAHIPMTFWEFKEFSSLEKAEQYNVQRKQPNGVVYHITK